MLFYIIVAVLVSLVLVVKAKQVQRRRREIAREAQQRISEKKWRATLDNSARAVLRARNSREMRQVVDSLDGAVIERMESYAHQYRKGSLFRLAADKYRRHTNASAKRKNRRLHEVLRHELINKLFASDTLESKLVALARLIEHEQSIGLPNEKLPDEEIREAVEGYLDEVRFLEELSETARLNLEGYLEVTSLMKRVWYSDDYRRDLLKALQDFITYPDDWYELVVHFRQDPSINEFPFVRRRGVTSMLIAENAAIAIHKRDLVGVQIARAHAANKPDHRTMMGDVMLEQLNRLVAALHKEKNLFQDETETVKG